MSPLNSSILLAVVLMVVVTAAVVSGEGTAVTLTLERANHEGLELRQLRDRDRVRHRRFLQQQSIGVVDFSVDGTYEPVLAGMYYTRVKLGNPPKEFYVQIDTGSDVLWVSCKSCVGCPASTGLQIQLAFFDPSSSSSAAFIRCIDPRCISGAQYSDAMCIDHGQCGYKFEYGDGSGTSGYYLSDTMYFDTIVGNSLTSNFSAPVVFGCSTSHTGDLTRPERAVDGIFGFGQQALSVISQLSSKGITPKAFSHCLKGGRSGGGILVLGEIVEPNLVYTPIVPSQPHYNVHLQSIAVNGQIVPIDSSVFATSSTRGTIIDSGTTLTYLAEQAYGPVIDAIMQTASPSVRSKEECYVVRTSVSAIFPEVTFNFAGGASMTLRPEDYLLQQNSNGGSSGWCIGFQKLSGQEITILGDLVLKDKIVVYDLARQRIGWANYDCSQSVNVSMSNSGQTQFVSAGQVHKNSAPEYEVSKLIRSTLVAFLLYIAFFQFYDHY